MSIISITNHSEEPLHVEVGDAAHTTVVLKHGESFQTDECSAVAAYPASSRGLVEPTPEPTPEPTSEPTSEPTDLPSIPVQPKKPK